jgi:hypothetical protein
LFSESQLDINNSSWLFLCVQILRLRCLVEGRAHRVFGTRDCIQNINLCISIGIGIPVLIDAAIDYSKCWLGVWYFVIQGQKCIPSINLYDFGFGLLHYFK